MKFDRLSGDSSDTSKSDITVCKNYVFVQLIWWTDRSQQTVSTLYQIVGFQHIFRCWLSSFVPSFIFEWWFRTLLHNLCNKASVAQLMKIFLQQLYSVNGPWWF